MQRNIHSYLYIFSEPETEPEPFEIHYSEVPDGIAFNNVDIKSIKYETTEVEDDVSNQSNEMMDDLPNYATVLSSPVHSYES